MTSFSPEEEILALKTNVSDNLKQRRSSLQNVLDHLDQSLETLKTLSALPHVGRKDRQFREMQAAVGNAHRKVSLMIEFPPAEALEADSGFIAQRVGTILRNQS